jgi:hypothetical protein
MMLHIDGSDHQWFQDERRHDLIVILDDATSEIYYAQLAPEETTFTVMAGLRAVIEHKGLFCSLYSDRGAHFWLTPKSGGKVDYEREPPAIARLLCRLSLGSSEPTWDPVLVLKIGIAECRFQIAFLSRHKIQNCDQTPEQPYDENTDAAEKDGPSEPNCQVSDIYGITGESVGAPHYKK